ncbi:MAG: PASTA domain-containing protein, partial [Clostridia bacterium]|nr:PASTA domain-containing protein [Clostridia bacterium]
EYKDKFTFVTEESYSGNYEKGVITGQSPDRSTKVPEGTVVTLTVSKGIKVTTIPKLVGEDVESAVKILQNLGFLTKTEYEFSDTVGEKKIISCDPADGTSAPYGTEITLVVSKGKQIQLVKVPNVLGSDVNDAINSISAAELVVLVEYEKSDTVKVNSVISQSIAPFTQVAKQTKVTIVVSEGPADNGGAENNG